MKSWLSALCLLFASLGFANAVPDFYGPLRHAEVGNANIAYYRFGFGAPLLLITGHGDAMTMWHPTLLKKLSKTREVIMFDYPGIGESTIKGEYPNSMEKLSSLVQAFIESQKLERPDLLGFSMGGSLALYMSTQNGSKYHHVVLVGAKAGGKKTVVPDARSFNMLNDTKISPATAIKTLLFPATAAPQADAYLKILSQMPIPKMNPDALKAQSEAVNAENQGEGVWDRLPLIKNRVLVINGTEDILTPVQNAPMIAAAIPGAWLAQIKGAGHGVLFQEPDFTGDLIELFLSY
ncbi:alpha/beta fold hydrolase [Legionella sp. CNM-4043-24]|uniref:alpha/beta fold hydrolase n=1 Tax=Legionella sp. CNM-4043-24 TaxID=3421646 RepID=UPI00403B17C4